VFTYKHLLSDPVFECDGVWYMRVGDTRAVMIRHYDGTPLEGFHPGWSAAFAYTGLGCMTMLTLRREDRLSTWMVSLDGRRLGDKLVELRPDQRARLRDAVLTRGLAGPGGLAGDGIQLIEPLLLADVLKLASEDKVASSVQAAAPENNLAMLGAPHKLRTHLHHHPGDRTLLLQDGWSTSEPDIGRAVGASSTAHAGTVPPASRQLLCLTLIPVAADPAVRQEKSPIEIVVNGRVISEIRLDPKWQREGADLAFWLPPELVGGRPFEITFRHSQDFVLETLKLSQGHALPELMLDPAELMLQFENIGDNCEFGLVQRHFNADPVGLLRFAGLGDPRRLIRFLDDDFG